MVSFSEDWLRLRARFDAAARSPTLEAALAAWATARATERPLAIVDLGAGSGNNRRHLAARLPVTQAWTLVDSDPALLDAARRADLQIDVRRLDLATELEQAIPEGTDLVTASALIDLVSREWLERLLARVDTVGAGLFVVLTYDGRIEWAAADPFDARILDLVNRHQRRDKGFGPALGPDAGPALARLAGDRAAADASDWKIGPGDAAMRAALVEGWAAAASESAPEEAAAIARWRESATRRESTLTVGHLDQWIRPLA